MVITEQQQSSTFAFALVTAADASILLDASRRYFFVEGCGLVMVESLFCVCFLSSTLGL